VPLGSSSAPTFDLETGKVRITDLIGADRAVA